MSLAVVAAAATVVALRPHCREALQNAALPVLGVTVLPVTAGTARLLHSAASARTHKVAVYALMIWAEVVSHTIYFITVETCQDLMLNCFFTIADLLWIGGIIYFDLFLVHNRLAQMELATGRSAVVWPRRVLWAGGACCFLVAVYYAADRFQVAFLPEAVITAAWWGIFALLQLWAGLCLQAFAHARVLAAEAVRGSVGRRQEQAQAAHRAAGDQMLALLLASLSSTLRLVQRMDLVLTMPWPRFSLRPMTGIFEAVDVLGNCLAALWLVGAFRGGLRAAEGDARRSDAQAQAWRQAAREWAPHEDARWQGKVVELSERGISLKALLDFYEGLGVDYMHHWDAERHTTSDVVRHAIIPQSAEARSALSTVLMEGIPTRPQKMVTHSWGNRFTDLMAAICADALGEDEFGPVRRLLLKDLALLRRWLADAGKLSASYWVCAFCVNQHQTICNATMPHDRDSVTGQPYPHCACGLPKVGNLTPPVASVGGSVDCEVNKFHAMMRQLSVEDTRFEQVVAIDGEFNLFTRAWCLAELATANAMGMRQRLKLRWAEDLECREEELRGLKMENMNASRPEDKEEILAGIPDIAAFNASLQRLLFQDLLPGWRSLDAEQQMERVSRLARFVRLGPDSLSSARSSHSNPVLRAVTRVIGRGFASEHTEASEKPAQEPEIDNVDSAEWAKEIEEAEEAKVEVSHL